MKLCFYWQSPFFSGQRLKVHVGVQDAPCFILKKIIFCLKCPGANNRLIFRIQLFGLLTNSVH